MGRVADMSWTRRLAVRAGRGSRCRCGAPATSPADTPSPLPRQRRGQARGAHPWAAGRRHARKGGLLGWWRLPSEAAVALAAAAERGQARGAHPWAAGRRHARKGGLLGWWRLPSEAAVALAAAAETGACTAQEREWRRREACSAAPHILRGSESGSRQRGSRWRACGRRRRVLGCQRDSLALCPLGSGHPAQVPRTRPPFRRTPASG